MAETLSTNSKIVVFDSGVNLDDANTNNVKQGATVGDILALSGGGGGATLVTDLPTFDATKIGEKVYFNGEEWIYASQEWLEALHLDSLVTPGYALPVNFAFGSNAYYENWQRITGAQTHKIAVANQFGNVLSLIPSPETYALGATVPVTWDFRHIYPNASRFNSEQSIYNNKGGYNIGAISYTSPVDGTTVQSFTIEKFEGVELLNWLEDVGTGVAFYASLVSGSATPIGCSTATIEDFFTRLPATTKTATLDVTNFSGGAAANASIATAKGYIVIQ